MTSARNLGVLHYALGAVGDPLRGLPRPPVDGERRTERPVRRVAARLRADENAGH